MSNSVSKFINYSSSFSNYYLIVAEKEDSFSACMSFNDFKHIPNATLGVSLPENKEEFICSVALTKNQITHLLSLDCPDAFIAYALTLCSLSPESSNHTNRRLGCTDKELMGGILIRHSLLNETVPVVRSYPKSDLLRHESYPVNNSQLPVNLE